MSCKERNESSKAFHRKKYSSFPVIIGDMPYGLPDTRILDDTVIGSAVWAELLLWGGRIENDQVIIPENLNIPDVVSCGSLAR